PEVAGTVWLNVVRLGRLAEGETLLVHGGAGGIGTHAIQVGKALGARVATTAGTADRLAHCRELGADILINHREQDFVEELRPVGGAGVILDNMGAKYLGRNVSTLAGGGRPMVIGMHVRSRAALELAALRGRRPVASG